MAKPVIYKDPTSGRVVALFVEHVTALERMPQGHWIAHVSMQAFTVPESAAREMLFAVGIATDRFEQVVKADASYWSGTEASAKTGESGNPNYPSANLTNNQKSPF